MRISYSTILVCFCITLIVQNCNNSESAFQNTSQLDESEILITKKQPELNTFSFDNEHDLIRIEENDIKILDGTAVELAKKSALWQQQRINEVKLKYFAKMIAKSLRGKDVATYIRSKIEEKFDGDLNVLWESVAQRTFDGVTLKEILNSRLSKDQLQILNMDLIEQIDLLQIALPASFDKWEPSQSILVAFVPQTTNDIDWETLTAFGSDGSEYVLDAKNKPSFPVLAVGINERIDPITRKAIKSGCTIQPLDHDVPPRLYPLVEDDPQKQSLSSLKKVKSMGGRQVFLTNYKAIDDCEAWILGKAEVNVYAVTDLGRSVGYRVNDEYTEDKWIGLTNYWFTYTQDLGRFLTVEWLEIDANGMNKNLNLEINASAAYDNVIRHPNSVPPSSDGSSPNAGSGTVTSNIKASASWKIDNSDDPMGKIGLVDLSGAPLNSTQESRTTYYSAGVVRFTLWWRDITDYYVSGLNPVGDQIWQGNTSGKLDNWDVDGTDGSDVTYVMDVRTTVSFDLTTCVPIPNIPGKTYTNYDTKIQIFTTNGPTQFYNDDDFDGCTINTTASGIKNIYLTPGFYWLVIDGYGGATGDFALKVSNVVYH